jgi:hypothetical protein
MADTASSAFGTGAGGPQLLRAEDEDRYQRLFADQAVRSYLYLSLGIGIIAVLLPFFLMIAGGYHDHDSLSSFYHTKGGPARDIMVGSLCAVGVFLFLFHGLSSLENWLLNAAGVAVSLVALVPSPGDTGYGSAWVHRGAAIVFFLLLAVVAIFLSKGRIKDIVDEQKRKWFAMAYTAAGVAMFAMPLIVAGLQFLPEEMFKDHWVFWTECTGIWCFAAYWFLKTAEYRLLLKVRWMA